MTSFVDHVVVHVASGSGGHGCASVHREKFKPLGGPDGGNGGRGGDVIVRVDPQVTTLLEYHHRPHQRADSGGPGRGSNQNGANGSDRILPVPEGTVVRDSTGLVLGELIGAGSQLTLAPGGRGGLGNAALASRRRKAPGFALLGEPGWEGDITLELKTVADIGLVGFPSAGKSSLIAAISAARPKIADYPFTTLVPHLGVVQAGDVRYTVADVPGLIPGASQGKGLGLEFLRHIERCSVLVHVIDGATLEPGRDPLNDLAAIRAELRAYPVDDGQVPLDERPAMVVINKIDVPLAAEMAEVITPEIEALGLRVFPVSAATHAGLRGWTFAMAADIAQARADAPPLLPQRVIVRPPAVDDAAFTVVAQTASDGSTYFRVVGARPQRWVQQTNMSNDEAVGYLADRLARLGVEEQLMKLGAVPGDPVLIGPGDNAVVFDWEPTIAAGAGAGPAAPRGNDVRLDSGMRPSQQARHEAQLIHDDEDESAEV